MIPAIKTFIAQILHFVPQSLILAGMVLAILAVLALMGGWIVLAFLPPRDALRWPIYAPVAGMAFVTAIGLPLAKLGLHAGQFAPVLAAVGAVLTVAIAWKRLRSHQGKRILVAYLRARGYSAAMVFGVVIVLSTWLIVWRSGTSVRTLWGSGDFGAYWIMADYLQAHGASLAEYEQQRVYLASDIADHLGKHARLGCMVYLAVVGRLISPQAIYQIVIPATIAAMILMLGLAQCWLDRERPAVRWLIAAVAAYPFLYFMLYFTYASQAFGVTLFLAGVLLANRARTFSSANGIAPAAVTGAMIGTSLLHYPSMLVATAVFGLVSLVVAARTRQWIPLVVASVAIAVTYGYYVPDTVRELQWAASAPRPPGWNWQGLIGPYEFTGFRTVLGYELPTIHRRLFRIPEFLALVALALLVVAGVRRSRLKAESLTLVATTGLLAAVALVNYFQHKHAATHGFVKVVSTFAPVVFLLALLPVGRWIHRQAVVPRRIAFAAVLAVILIGQLASLRRGEPVQAWYESSLIPLARRQLDRGEMLHFRKPLPPIMVAPMVRDARRASTWSDALPAWTVELVENPALTSADSSRIIDREGGYTALRRK